MLKRRISAVIVWLVTTPVFADVYVPSKTWSILSPTDAAVEAYKNDLVHDPYIAPLDKDLSYGANFILDFDLLKYKGYGLYWNNLLHFDESRLDGRIKHAGWQYELGCTLYHSGGINRVELFKQHHSRHILEEERDQHFPVYDRHGIRLRVYP